jgi:hypothetical protein
MASLPSPDQLQEAPERAALALLDAALAVARAALIAENPDIVLLGDPDHGRDPPKTRVLAGRLLVRVDKLRDLLDRYVLELDHLRRERLEEDFPF